MKEIKMLKLPLQFFGEDGGGDDDFTDDFFDDGDDYYDTDEFDDGDLDADLDVGSDVDGDPSSVSGADTTSDVASATESVASPQGEALGADDGADSDPSSVGEPTPSPEGEGKSGGASPSPTEQADDLISELRALGYVGNDLAALTADMKKKREAQAAQDAKREAAATKAAGKNHIRSGKPGKSASGDGTGGVTERQVEHFVSLTKESRESARQRLTRHARLIEGK